MVLMERAASSVVEAMMDEKLDLSSVLVFCGSGNNGGDGYAIARMLNERRIPVETVFVGKTASMTEETTFEREMTPLKAIRDNYPKMVITLDPYTSGNYEGIHVINAIDWLLDR